jgi:hypothetical protein
MIFDYRPTFWGVAEDGDFLFVTRPEIAVSIVGPLGSVSQIGLVDTGSDHTIFPRSVADWLGVTLKEAEGPPTTVFGGSLVKLLEGEVSLVLESNGDRLAWTTRVCFFDFPDPATEASVLGHAGFLNFFTAVFDGQNATLELIPNTDLP